MAKYAVGIRPLINTLAEHTKVGECIQAWYADDSSAVGILKKLKEWWDALCITGPKLGYFRRYSHDHSITSEVLSLVCPSLRV